MSKETHVVREIMDERMKRKIALRNGGGNWRDIEDDREKYSAYLCSREWSVLKEAVKKRSGGMCERCKVLEGDAVHHVTYERKYAERLDDLQHICNPCHEFTHGKDDFDPLLNVITLRWLRRSRGGIRPFPLELMYEIAEPSPRSLLVIRACRAIEQMLEFSGNHCWDTHVCELWDALCRQAGFAIPIINLKAYFKWQVHPWEYDKACQIVGVPSRALPGDLAPNEE